MVQKSKTDIAGADDTSALRAHVLVLEARFYEHIADMMADGAIEELNARGVTFERIAVPGALELPQVLAAAAEARHQGRMAFDGAIALGCVIRGETYHFEIVCNNANHWLMDVAMAEDIPVGNAILTVENEAQAIARAEGGRKGKGGDAARACLRLIAAKRTFWGQSQ
jgi:6,7-dimethyl-8-ribityllumazine synthase